jgi:hypothetical protein
VADTSGDAVITEFCHFMDSTPLKVYIVTILDCENEAHAHKLAEFLRASFPHGAEQTTDTPPINLTMMVKAESLESIQEIISPVLGKAIAVFGRDLIWLEDGKASSTPPDNMRFEPPTNVAS